MRIGLLLSLILFVVFSSHGQITVDFETDTVCAGAQTHLYSMSTTTNGSITGYNWDLDNDGNFDDATDSSIFHNFNSFSTVSVGLQVVTDVPDTSFTYLTVTFNTIPSANFTANNACVNANVFFNNSSTDPEGDDLLFSWDFDDSNTSNNASPVHSYATGGVYAVQLIATDGVCNDTIVKNVTINNLPSVAIVFEDTIVCSGDFIALIANTSENFFWSTGETADTIQVNNAGTYYLVATDNLACIGRDSVSVVEASAPVLTVSNDTFMVAGEEISLMVSGASTYSWTPTEYVDAPTGSTVSIDPTQTTTFQVVGTSDEGCSSADSVMVTVYENYWIDYTNVITPNNDNANDQFEIRNIEFFEGCPLTIFNQVGNEVYQSSDYQNDWAGTFNGKQLPNDTYYFVIDCGQEEKSFAGTITLLR